MKLPILAISDVVEAQLCTGCGACASIEPGRFRMEDVVESGRRPCLVEQPVPETGDAVKACPGASLEHSFDRSDPELISDLVDAWGPAFEVWEGYASDDAIRRAGSSGGAATALALYGIERGGMGGVLHTGARSDSPYLNETVYSTSRAALLSNTGSRYAPASPCDSLHLIEQAERPSVFIGKPCDVAGVQKARALRPVLAEKVGLTIAFFCAGTPSTGGTLELLRKVGCSDPESLKSLRFRGNGWPGMWRAEWIDQSGVGREAELTYEESWGFLQSRRQWRCYICPDHTGEFADIAVGDPWYRPVQPGEAGKSLIVVRTKRGREALRGAVAAGYIVLESREPSLLPRSQGNLLRTRGRLWGQLVALRLFGVAPRYVGFRFFPFWLRHLGLKQKLESVVGTVRRLRTRSIVPRHHR